MSTVTLQATRPVSKPAISTDLVIVCLWAAFGLVLSALAGVTALVG